MIDSLVTAAVIVPYIDINGARHILFEKRSEDIDIQPGEICLPGGHIEPGESPEEAAVRETCEELLISPDNISDIKSLGSIQGPGNGLVSVFTASLTDYDYSFSREEVAQVFTVPVSYFMDTEPKCYETIAEYRYPDDFPFDDVPPIYRNMRMRRGYKVYFYYFKEYVIWGFTARVIHQMFEENYKRC